MNNRAKKLKKTHSITKKPQHKGTHSNIIDLQKKRKQKIQQKEIQQEKMLLKKNLTIQERNKIVENYLPMIQCIARRISSRLPSNIQYSDLISSAVIGLMDAIQKYDPSRNNKFKTYAEFRVRGAILDALRAQDWTPRSIRDKAKRIDRVTKTLEQKFSRPPNEKEIASALEVSLEEYHSMLNQTKEVSVVSIDESSIFNHTDKNFVLKMLEDADSSLNQINKKSLHKVIVEAIRELPERQRIVLSLYYYEEFNLRKIGQILKVTESRVSQLHAQAIERLKYKLINKIEKKELNVA
ncbi:MAG: FliA/WhiG family RNA polymerase sigma factor [Oligoflexia bacterium]|nr:FliA/WhiG family RNA polymerase sigma factor [Oligoflexia bacterium]